MRALTLWRPWPDAIFFGGKPVENRSYKPFRAIINEVIAIHAGKRYDFEGAEWMRRRGLYNPPGADWSPMGVVGVCVVTGHLVEGDPRAAEIPWFVGPYGWILDRVKRLPEAIQIDGHQGVWNLPPEVAARVMELAERVDYL